MTVPKVGRHCLLFFQKQKPKRVKAIYNCVADNPDELTFTEGEVIVVDGEEDQEWWVSIKRLLVILQQSAVHLLSGSVTMEAAAESHDLTLADALFLTATNKLLLPL